jgi:hypothetical protein
VVVRVSFACSSVFPPGLPRYAASPPYQHKRLRAVPTRQPSDHRRPESFNPGSSVKYLNNIVEQDHRAVKRITKPMLGFKSFRSARNVLVGIELMHMIRKGQMMEGCAGISFADQFYALAGQMRTA